MICPSCNRVYENETGKCPYCNNPPRLTKRQKEKSNESAFSSFPAVGRCPDCGQEVSGTLTHISSVVADAMTEVFGARPKATAFVPDEHSCPKGKA